MEAFCNSCARDKCWNGTKDPALCDEADYCPIIAASMLFHVNCEGYPPEWVYDAAGCPTCTTWKAMPKMRLSNCERCPDTLDMFDDAT